ncbi:hypothetical protein BU16DRAFT_601049 [Lophium mytilinum]|uniref:Uncharacterized protein n=1 Tax=Lophium mytilinum TaxID=390894 RepID=A0A6A6Q9U4_9PEZI|nr:hypothetical protein BU16DRAFT_601049 [Lophium mytilinum]
MAGAPCETWQMNKTLSLVVDSHLSGLICTPTTARREATPGSLRWALASLIAEDWLLADEGAVRIARELHVELFEASGVNCKEAMIFLDVSIRSFGGMVSDASSASDETSDSLPSSSGGESNKTVEEKMSGILGFSTSNKSSINGDFTSKNALPIPETYLKGLLRRHPKGKIY